MFGIPGSSNQTNAPNVRGIPSFNGNLTIPESEPKNCFTLDQFEKCNKVTDGSFGNVYVCRHISGSIFFIAKKLDLSLDPQHGVPKSVMKEITMLKRLNHDNIVNSHGIIAGNSLEKAYLLLDYCPHSLKGLIDSGDITLYERSMTKSVMKQIFEGLAYIHKAKIIHGCLNPLNVKLTEEKSVKIGRFEYACSFNDKQKASPEANLLQYRAPELLLHSNDYTSAVDMWAAGCIFAELTVHKPIFCGDTDIELFNSIISVLGSPSEAIWPGFDDLFSKFKNGAYGVAFNQKSKLTSILCKASAASKNMIMDLLLYCPDGRLTSEECFGHALFKEEKSLS